MPSENANKWKSTRNSKKMNYEELISLCENVKKTKSEVRASENVWSRYGKFGEKAEFVYSEYDRLINALKQEIEKKKNQNKDQSS